MVPVGGLEPPRSCEQGILNPSCLPISSHWHRWRELYANHLNDQVETNCYCKISTWNEPLFIWVKITVFAFSSSFAGISIVELEFRDSFVVLIRT